MKHITKILLLITLLQVVGCAKKAEEQQLASFRSSLSYRTYSLASKTTVELATTEYQKATSEEMDKMAFHGLVGLLWLLADKPKFACVEADLCSLAANGKPDNQARGIRTLAFYKMSWPNLASKEYETLLFSLAAQKNMSVAEIAVEHKETLLCLIFVGILQRNNTLAMQSAQTLGSICQLDYIAPLVSLSIEARDGNILAALEQLNELRKSSQFSKHREVLLGETKNILEEHKAQGSLPSDAFERLMITLGEGILADVFDKDSMSILLNKARDLTETFSKNVDVSRSEQPARGDGIHDP